MSEETRTPDRVSARSSLRLVVIAGSLCMVYTVGVGSPAATEFFRAIGAREVDFGLITGLPMIMLVLQFYGAAILNRVRHRKATFIVGTVTSRLLYLAIAFVPLLLMNRAPRWSVPMVIAMLGISAAMDNFTVPFWFSWMADLIPRRVLNRVWGSRQRAMHIVWTASYLGVAVLLYAIDWPATVTYPLLIVVGVVAGVTDILLYFRVREPPNLTSETESVLRSLGAPWVHPQYRTFVLASGFWTFATMFGAAFMQLYVLKVLGVAAWKATLIWCLLGVGAAAASRLWGRVADRHGQRPVMNICVSFKPMIVIAFLLVTPRNVLWLLPVAFVLDGVLNAGYGVAQNGYMLSIAPRRNRSMFIAAITSLSGVAGGLSAILSGALLSRTESFHWAFLGRDWHHYHLIFAASLCMRLACIPLIRRIREPESSRSLLVLDDLFDGWPKRVIRFPVGLYRRVSPFHGESPSSD